MQQLCHRLTVEIIEIDDAELTALLCDIADDLACFRFADRKLIFRGIEALDHLDKCLNRKGIMLR